MRKTVAASLLLIAMAIFGSIMNFYRAPEDYFWSFYGDFERWGDDFVDEINREYSSLSKEDRRRVSLGFYEVFYRMQRQEMFDLCRIFGKGFCGDDRFSYFVRSIIYMGKDYCVNIVDDPDLFFSLALDNGWGDYGFWVEDFGDLENNDFGAADGFFDENLLKKSESELKKEYPRTFAYCYSERC